MQRAERVSRRRYGYGVQKSIPTSSGEKIVKFSGSLQLLSTTVKKFKLYEIQICKIF